jgi:hypothetical protein
MNNTKDTGGIPQKIWKMAAESAKEKKPCSFDKKAVTDCARGKISGEQKSVIEDHIHNCWECFDMVLDTRYRDEVWREKINQIYEVLDNIWAVARAWVILQPLAPAYATRSVSGEKRGFGNIDKIIKNIDKQDIDKKFTYKIGSCEPIDFKVPETAKFVTMILIDPDKNTADPVFINKSIKKTSNIISYTPKENTFGKEDIGKRLLLIIKSTDEISIPLKSGKINLEALKKVFAENVQNSEVQVEIVLMNFTQ